MAQWMSSLRKPARMARLAGALAGILWLAGCGKSSPDVPAEQAGGDKGPAVENPAKNPALAKDDSFFRQSFAEATISDPPDGAVLPDKTMAGKSVGKLYTAVLEEWKKIPFITQGGKRLHYRATLATDLGNMEITFRPDLAPNHVRSFVALARAGYYDGLVFERIVHEESAHSKLDLIEAGCPLGTGEENFGSIGYWLKPEFSDQVHHEEGTVGACHKEEADTAACKFYITLTKAPVIDGRFTVFGKVSKGLDVARKIGQLPLQTEDGYGDRPKNPIVIQKVTIHSEEVAD